MRLTEALLLLLVVQQVCSFSFTVEPRERMCFFDEVKAGDDITIMFQVVSGGVRDIDVKVTSPSDMVVWTQNRQTEGRTTFITETNGRFTTCFDNTFSSMSSKVIVFQALSGGRHRIVQDAAPKVVPGLEPVKQKDVELRNSAIGRTINDFAGLVGELQNDLEAMKMREQVHRNTNESTNERVMFWALFEMLMLLAMSLGQIFYMRRLFEVKRVI